MTARCPALQMFLDAAFDAHNCLSTAPQAPLAPGDQSETGNTHAVAGYAMEPAPRLRPSRLYARDGRVNASVACELTAAFRALEPALEWRRRSSHDDTASANFIDGHANATIMGTGGFEARDDVWLGISRYAPCHAAGDGQFAR